MEQPKFHRLPSDPTRMNREQILKSLERVKLEIAGLEARNSTEPYVEGLRSFKQFLEAQLKQKSSLILP